MTEITRVTVKRLLKDKVFYIAAAVTFLISIYIAVTNAPVMAEWINTGESHGLEDCYFNLIPILGLIFASFVSIFLGVEHSDGTLRNKIIAGHSRASIFFSFFAVSSAACLILTALWAVAGLAGLKWVSFSYGWDTYAIIMVIAACGALFFAALFTTMSMIIPNKAIGAVASLVLWFVLLLGCSVICNMLSTPEMIYDYVSVGESFVQSDPYPNPYYVSGIKRTVMEFITYICPVCHSINMSNSEVEKPLFDILGSLGSTVIILIGGCLAFRKKDLK